MVLYRQTDRAAPLPGSEWNAPAGPFPASVSLSGDLTDVKLKTTPLPASLRRHGRPWRARRPATQPRAATAARRRTNATSRAVWTSPPLVNHTQSLNIKQPCEIQKRARASPGEREPAKTHHARPCRVRRWLAPARGMHAQGRQKVPSFVFLARRPTDRHADRQTAGEG